MSKPESLEALAQQRTRDRKKINDLEARLAAYRARLNITAGDEANPHRNDPEASDQELLEHLAAALHLARIAELAHTGKALHDGPPTTDLRDNARPLPGSATSRIRYRTADLRRDIREAIGAFDWASANEWKRKPSPDAHIPRLRCGNRDCAARGVHVKAWYTIRGGKTIYRERCATCGQPYPQPEENGDAA